MPSKYTKVGRWHPFRELNGSWKGGLKFDCDFCGKRHHIVKTSGNIKGGILKFCNPKCRALHANRVPSGDKKERRMFIRARVSLLNTTSVYYDEYGEEIYQLQVAWEKAMMELSKIVGKRVYFQ